MMRKSIQKHMYENTRNKIIKRIKELNTQKEEEFTSWNPKKYTATMKSSPKHDKTHEQRNLRM